MLNYIFDSILATTETGAVSPGSILMCTAGSLLLGFIIACIHMYRNTYSKNFVITLALLPAIIQIVIMMVNGNIGTGVAVMGAFSLVRFRSAPGSAKEICNIFLAMAIGLASGTGYLGVAATFLIIYGILNIIYTRSSFGETKKSEKEIKITIPEDLDYTDLFDDLFTEYTDRHELVRVKTTNMGSLYQLYYQIQVKDVSREKAFLDEIRCRNGNLDIVLGRISTERTEL